MRRTATVLALMLVAGCSPASEVPLATAAADTFHEQFNAGAYSAIYASADRLIREPSPEKAFVAMLADVHAKTGDFRSAEPPGWNDQVTSNGHFVKLIYHAKFAQGDADEEFVFRIDGGRAVLASFHITSQALSPPPAAPASE